MRVSVPVLAALLSIGCGKQPVEEAPKAGWIQSEGWAGACYYPPDWEAMGTGDRKIARQKVLEEMMGQWKGSRDDGVSLDEDAILNMETALLGRPERIEDVAGQNAQKCEQFMAAGASDSGAWSSWLAAETKAMTAGDCNRPLVDTYFNYLDIGQSWQNKVSICKDNKIRVIGSAIDYYRITENGPWINAAGDTSISTSASQELPCNIEGCYAGMLIMRFVGDSGIEQIIPVGTGAEFTAPEHGYIQVMINDSTFYDNKYKIESGLEHHTSITYEPA